MIPLWLSIPCIIVCFIVIVLWFMSIDIDWERAFYTARDIAITMIVIACSIVAGLSIVQWIKFGVTG